MSFHSKERHPKYNTTRIRNALRRHGLDADKPSQLSDAFRLGYLARKREGLPFWVKVALIVCGLLIAFEVQ